MAAYWMQEHGDPSFFPCVCDDFPRTAAAQAMLEATSYRPFAGNPFGHVDAAPFGGGPGMVLRPDVLRDALASLPRRGTGRVIHFSPAAPPLDHAKVLELAALDQLILVCTRFEGLDQRAVRLCVDEELSVGDAVLSGGELPALFLIDAVCRWLPGVLGNEASAAADSFATGLLDHPHYTRPAEFAGLRTPEVLLNGDHSQIRRWRREQQLRKTLANRPDLLANAALSKEDRKMLQMIREERPI